MEITIRSQSSDGELSRDSIFEITESDVLLCTAPPDATVEQVYLIGEYIGDALKSGTKVLTVPHGMSFNVLSFKQRDNAKEME